MISNLGLEAVDVYGSGDHIGGLAGWSCGSIATSYSTGTVSGDDGVGGLVGYNDDDASVIASYSTATVRGDVDVGGLAGFNYGIVARCHGTPVVWGVKNVAGLVGGSEDRIVATSTFSGTVHGEDNVGGLVGYMDGEGVIDCNNTGTVHGIARVGGVVGCIDEDGRGFCGRDGQRHRRYLVDCRRPGLSAAVVGARR